ncbi:hypothetical protein EGI22_22100 [Lacihabitans sp. LS3-19]|uniref:glycine-rich domain-containing protein n=1 Tax=Lacihabitans sp. LS3-19 TaxID=2487335 RepID=UPI0020CEBE51|nr:hypothetical protein [Lacihabitans sp. LS3-19]MCP9770609.1 hypothetical protein [Lacihabitans sp. LS3-19]
MKKIDLVLIMLILLINFPDYAQSVTISPNGNSAIVDVSSTSKGLVLPKVTSPPTTIQSPSAGMVVYDQSNANLAYYNGAQWSNLTGTAGNQGLYSRFPNSQGFMSELYNSSPSYVSSSWIVPAGVNQIWVEAWGAGDAGFVMPTTSSNTTFTTGGDAGDFASFVVNVTPGETLSIEVGKGGTSTNINGGSTRLITSAAPARTYAVSQQRTGVLFNNIVQTTLPGLIQFVAGQDGGISSTTYVQAGSTDFRRIITGGKGGDSYPNQRGGSGNTISYDMSDNSTTGNLISVTASGGSTPGAGGGSSVGLGGSAGAGLLIIHW